MVSTEVKARIAEAYRAGATLIALAAAWECHHCTVRRWLLEQGVTMRRRGRRRSAE